MKISGSILDLNSKEQIDNLNNTQIDFIHLDIMDGLFVVNKTKKIDEYKYLLKDINKSLEIHLMVKDVKSYIDSYKVFNPKYIIFHYEAVNDCNEIINYIKNLDIKVGISINPKTDIDVLIPYLDKIDLVLIMSVEPGLGGQIFIPNVIEKIDKLNKLKGDFLIEIDGGINDKTIKFVNVDIAVVGSYITKSDNYKKQIDKLK